MGNEAGLGETFLKDGLLKEETEIIFEDSDEVTDSEEEMDDEETFKKNTGRMD